MSNRGASPAHNVWALGHYWKLAIAVLNRISETPKKTIPKSARGASSGQTISSPAAGTTPPAQSSRSGASARIASRPRANASCLPARSPPPRANQDAHNGADEQTELPHRAGKGREQNAKSASGDLVDRHAGDKAGHRTGQWAPMMSCATSSTDAVAASRRSMETHSGR